MSYIDEHNYDRVANWHPANPVLAALYYVPDYVEGGDFPDRPAVTGLGRSWYLRNDGDTQYQVLGAGGGTRPWEDGWAVQYAYYEIIDDPK